MSSLEIDTERLTQGAGALRAHASWLTRAVGELDVGAALAFAGCGHVADGGLDGALRRLHESWDYDIAAIAKDLEALGDVMQSLAQMYSAVDSDGAQQLGG